MSLKERQEVNALLDVQKKVLTVAGLMEEGEDIDRATVQKRFADNITAKVVDMETGQYDETIDPDAFDQRAASKDTATSEPAPVPRPGPTGMAFSRAQRMKSATIRKYPGKPIWVITSSSRSRRSR